MLVGYVHMHINRCKSRISNAPKAAATKCIYKNAHTMVIAQKRVKLSFYLGLTLTSHLIEFNAEKIFEYLA